NAYSWEKEVYKGGEANGWYFIDWTSGYMRIHWANQVLDGLERIEPDGGQLSAWNLANGCAYFHRALNYYSLAQLYCPVFEAATSDEALGLPLRLEADLTLHTPRSNLRDTYSQIIGDLKKAADLLPNSAINKYRPS